MTLYSACEAFYASPSYLTARNYGLVACEAYETNSIGKSELAIVLGIIEAWLKGE